MITKHRLEGTMEKAPAPYAPASYHHPHPTLACIKACLQKCLPEIREFRLVETHDGNDTTIVVRICTRYRGEIEKVFTGYVLEIVQRHVLKTHDPVFLLLDVKHGKPIRLRSNRDLKPPKPGPKVCANPQCRKPWLTTRGKPARAIEGHGHPTCDCAAEPYGMRLWTDAKEEEARP